MLRKAFILFVLAIAIPVGAGERLAIRLSPGVAFEPAVLTVRAVVESDADNRALEIFAESATFYRSSSIQLDGAKAPRLNVFEFRNLPTGTYGVTSVLIGADGQRTSVSRIFRVASASGTSR